MHFVPGPSVRSPLILFHQIIHRPVPQSLKIGLSAKSPTHKRIDHLKIISMNSTSMQVPKTLSSFDATLVETCPFPWQAWAKGEPTKFANAKRRQCYAASCFAITSFTEAWPLSSGP